NADYSSAITLFPNPCSEYVGLQWQGGVDAMEWTITLSDLQGRTIATKRLQPGATVCWFDATTLPSGSYLVSGMSGTAFFSKGVVVSH
ncbi:MAG: T9SS type A sorting domain-containing protein, partial [Flavobacteriales bacterium]